MSHSAAFDISEISPVAGSQLRSIALWTVDHSR